MKRIFTKILALFLTILVLFSSSFITLDTHFCCGNVVDSSIFGKADVCAMDMVSCRLEDTSTTKLKNSCCYNIKDYKSAQLFEKNAPIVFDLPQFDFSPNFYLTTTSNFIIESEVDINHYKDYRPPLITKDILVLVQRFLI